MIDRQQRHVRFLLTRFEHVGPDRCAVSVELQGASATYFGHAEGECQDVGGLRAVAQATADALHDLGHVVTVEDVDLIRAFGEPAVIVRILARYEEETRHVVGFSLAGDDPMRAAALAVLNATNRFFEIG